MSDSQGNVPRLTLEEAARCIRHLQTGKAISPVSLRAWIMQARQANRPFRDERVRQRAGAAHYLTIAQIELLLIGRPYQFVPPHHASQQSEDSVEIRKLKEKLHALQREYEALAELWHQVQPFEPAPVGESYPRRGENAGVSGYGDASERALRENVEGGGAETL